MRKPTSPGTKLEIKAWVDKNRRPVTVFTTAGKVFYEYHGVDPDPTGMVRLSYCGGHYDSIRALGDDATEDEKRWTDQHTEELFVHWENKNLGSLDPLDTRSSYLKRAFNDMSESVKELGFTTFERHYREKGKKYASDQGGWKRKFFVITCRCCWWCCCLFVDTSSCFIW